MLVVTFSLKQKIINFADALKNVSDQTGLLSGEH